MISAIICEYNPLHNGHIYHIDTTRSIMAEHSHDTRDYIIAIMSGNFTQRGEIAILNKYTRARLALECGVDMVIELPSIYATSSAELFAKGAIEIISHINDIDYVSFGSELGDIEYIKSIVNAQSSTAYDDYIKEYLARGNSYPLSSNMAMNALGLIDYNSISSPNDVLGIEYYKQALAYGIADKLIAIKRRGSGYNDTTIEDNYSSASAIRHSMLTNNYLTIASNVPPTVFSKLQSASVDYEKLLSIIAYNTLSVSYIYEDTEGLVNRLKRFAMQAISYEQLINQVHTKRYTKSKIRRIALHMCLNHTKSMTTLNNIRVLGVRKDAVALLSLINKTLASEVIADNDIFANQLYNIVSMDKITLDKMLLV